MSKHPECKKHFAGQPSITSHLVKFHKIEGRLLKELMKLVMEDPVNKFNRMNGGEFSAFTQVKNFGGEGLYEKEEEDTDTFGSVSEEFKKVHESNQAIIVGQTIDKKLNCPTISKEEKKMFLETPILMNIGKEMQISDDSKISLRRSILIKKEQLIVRPANTFRAFCGNLFTAERVVEELFGKSIIHFSFFLTEVGKNLTKFGRFLIWMGYTVGTVEKKILAIFKFAKFALLNLELKPTATLTQREMLNGLRNGLRAILDHKTSMLKKLSIQKSYDFNKTSSIDKFSAEK